MTPIEKAAEDIRKSYERFLYPEDEPEIANIIRRRLEKEVPPRKVKITERISASDFSYNQARRDFLGKEE